MIKAFNSIKRFLLAIYQVMFIDAKKRYEITEEFYLEKCHQRAAMQERQCKKENS